MATTRIQRKIRAPRAEVYRALIDPAAILKWRFPAGMSISIHAFEARPGGSFRVSLAYETAEGKGKSSSRTDTYHGRFLELVPGEKVVEEIEFETADPALQGAMTITTTLADSEGGTLLAAVHAGLPAGLREEDNHAGWEDSLGKLATLVEKAGGAMEDLAPLEGKALPPGRYRHYKGKDYQVIGLARHSETLETLVVYRALYGEQGLWVRPLAMFQETVEVAGRRLPRFEKVD